MRLYCGAKSVPPDLIFGQDGAVGEPAYAVEHWCVGSNIFLTEFSLINLQCRDWTDNEVN